MIWKRQRTRSSGGDDDDASDMETCPARRLRWQYGWATIALRNDGNDGGCCPNITPAYIYRFDPGKMSKRHCNWRGLDLKMKEINLAIERVSLTVCGGNLKKGTYHEFGWMPGVAHAVNSVNASP